jgi:hypothetical protein
MSQDHQQIGQESDELAAVVAERQGWEGQPSKPQEQELVGDADFSFRDRRANRQALGFHRPGSTYGAEGPITPDEGSTPMAGMHPPAWGNLNAHRDMGDENDHDASNSGFFDTDSAGIIHPGPSRY